MLRRINRLLTTSPAHNNHFMSTYSDRSPLAARPTKDSAERGSRGEELSHANHRRRWTYQRSCLRRRNRRAHAQGQSDGETLTGVRSSALSLFETKPTRHGSSAAEGLESVSRQSPDQLDGSLPDRRPRGRKNYGAGMGGAGLQSL